MPSDDPYRALARGPAEPRASAVQQHLSSTEHNLLPSLCYHRMEIPASGSSQPSLGCFPTSYTPSWVLSAALWLLCVCAVTHGAPVFEPGFASLLDNSVKLCSWGLGSLCPLCWVTAACRTSLIKGGQLSSFGRRSGSVTGRSCWDWCYLSWLRR